MVDLVCQRANDCDVKYAACSWGNDFRVGRGNESKSGYDIVDAAFLGNVGEKRDCRM
jgi:hypothetical protein